MNRKGDQLQSGTIPGYPTASYIYTIFNLKWIYGPKEIINGKSKYCRKAVSFQRLLEFQDSGRTEWSAGKTRKVYGEFVWHEHDNKDELFYAPKCSFTMEFCDRQVHLREYELLIVPKGVEHQPVARNEVSVMLFEPVYALNTGEVRGGLTRDKLG